MKYLLNEAFDELLDIISNLFWGVSYWENDEIPQNVKIQPSVIVPVVMAGVGASKIEYIGDNIRAVKTPLKPIKQARPGLKIAVVAKEALNLKTDNGLLGLLTGWHWDCANARHDYMRRCKQLSWVDETFIWKVPKRKVSVSEYESDLKRNETKRGNKGYNRIDAAYYYNYAPRDDAFNWRHGKSITSEKRARLRSLEQSFSNWSAPSWAVGLGLNAVKGRENERSFRAFEADFYDVSWCYSRDATGVGLARSQSYNFRRERNTPWDFAQRTIAPGFDNRTPWSGYKFLEPESGHGYITQASSSLYDPDGPDRWYDVLPHNYMAMSQFPGRLNWNNAFLDNKSRPRRKYKFEIANVDGINNKIFESMLSRYYDRGYNLVNCALDLLLARGHKDLLREFPEFVEHCLYWGIFPPDKNMAVRFDDISALGIAPKGFIGISSKSIVDYVIKICPSPGRVAPWDDNGPLWGWPDEFGTLQPLTGIARGYLPNIWKVRLSMSKPSWMSGFPMRAIQATSSVLLGAFGNAAGVAAAGLVNSAVNSVSSSIVQNAVQWVDELSYNLQSSSAFNVATDIIREVSGVSNEIRRLTDVNSLFATGLDIAREYAPQGLPEQIADFLDVAQDGTDRAARIAKQSLDGKLDALRDNWPYTDDLLATSATFGSVTQSAINKIS